MSSIQAIFIYSVPAYILSERFNFTQSKVSQGVDLAKRATKFAQNYI